MRKITVFFIFFAITMTGTAQSARPMISDIRATASPDTNSITITWSVSVASSALIQELLLYQSTDGIINADNLLSKKPLAVLQVNETEYQHFVDTRKNYYYAVVARQKDGILYDLIIPTVNATSSPVTLAAKISQSTTSAISSSPVVAHKSTVPPSGIQEAPLRQKPLPYLQILPEQKIEPTSTLNTETLQLTDRLGSVPHTEKILKADILPQDAMDLDDSGDDYTLFSIVDSLIRQGNWQAAEAELEQFLQINHSDEITARASFYLGQAYYFNKKYRNALFSFQESEKLYPSWSKKWIEEVLNHYLVN